MTSLGLLWSPSCAAGSGQAARGECGWLTLLAVVKKNKNKEGAASLHGFPLRAAKGSVSEPLSRDWQNPCLNHCAAPRNTQDRLPFDPHSTLRVRGALCPAGLAAFLLLSLLGLLAPWRRVQAVGAGPAPQGPALLRGPLMLMQSSCPFSPEGPWATMVCGVPVASPPSGLSDCPQRAPC